MSEEGLGAGCKGLFWAEAVWLISTLRTCSLQENPLAEKGKKDFIQKGHGEHNTYCSWVSEERGPQGPPREASFWPQPSLFPILLKVS